jgi:hypothetical protein
MVNETEFQERVRELEKEKQLFFDLAYKSYNELAAIADECKDRDVAHRIGEAITPLGMFIGRSAPRERPR